MNNKQGILNVEVNNIHCSIFDIEKIVLEKVIRFQKQCNNQ